MYWYRVVFSMLFHACVLMKCCSWLMMFFNVFVYVCYVVCAFYIIICDCYCYYYDVYLVVALLLLMRIVVDVSYVCILMFHYIIFLCGFLC